MREGADWLAEPLTKLFNLYLSSGPRFIASLPLTKNSLQLSMASVQDTPVKLNFLNQSTSGQSRSIKAQEHMLSFLISLGLLILYPIRGFFSSLTPTWVFEESSYKAFLLNRQQRVVIDGQFSNWFNVSSGVPQGSILGPMLFLIYVNDIGDDLSSTCKLFADDCVVFRPDQTLSNYSVT